MKIFTAPIQKTNRNILFWINQNDSSLFQHGFKSKNIEKNSIDYFELLLDRDNLLAKPLGILYLAPQ